MATSILTPGYAPVNITSGGGAAIVTVDVINAMWNNSQNQSRAAISNANVALALADPTPQLVPVILDKSYLPPAIPPFPSMDPNNGQAIYDAALAQLMAEIQDGFNYIVDNFFPNPQYAQDALDWCDRAIVQGGTGISTTQEQALWQRGRARVLADSARAEDDAMSSWANRRFPLPPGALVGAVQDIRLDAGRKLAEQSRDISVKSFDAEQENVRFAVKTLLDQRQAALQAAIDYGRTLMLAPSTAMQLATGLTGLQNEYLRSLVAYYGAEVAAAEPLVRLAITDATLKLQAEQANLTAQSASQDQKVKAALAAMQVVATQASAGINAIGGRASISGSDSSSV